MLFTVTFISKSTGNHEILGTFQSAKKAANNAQWMAGNGFTDVRVYRGQAGAELIKTYNNGVAA